MACSGCSSLISQLSCAVKEWMAWWVGRMRWQYLQRPMQPQSARFSHLFFWRLSSTQQQMRASTPTPKQLQKPRSSCVSPVATSRLSRIWMISPSGQVETRACQMSNQDSSASSHSSSRSFSPVRRPGPNATGEPPQPRQREKSFPVPIGMMQKVILVRSMPASPTSETTQRTVPSPPQTTAVTFPLPRRSTLTCARRIFSRPCWRCWASKRSRMCKEMVVAVPSWQVSRRLGSARQDLPTPPPDLPFTKRKKERRSSRASMAKMMGLYNQRSAWLHPRSLPVSRKRFRRVEELTLPQFPHERPLSTSVSTRPTTTPSPKRALATRGLNATTFPRQSVVNGAVFSRFRLGSGRSSSRKARMASSSLTLRFRSCVIFSSQPASTYPSQRGFPSAISLLPSNSFLRLLMARRLGSRCSLWRERCERQKEGFLAIPVCSGCGCGCCAAWGICGCGWCGWWSWWESGSQGSVMVLWVRVAAGWRWACSIMETWLMYCRQSSGISCARMWFRRRVFTSKKAYSRIRSIVYPAHCSALPPPSIQQQNNMQQ